MFSSGVYLCLQGVKERKPFEEQVSISMIVIFTCFISHYQSDVKMAQPEIGRAISHFWGFMSNQL